MKSIMSKKDVAFAHNKEVVSSNRLITGLRSLGDPVADRIADQIAAKLMDAGGAVDAGVAALVANQTAQIESKTATADLKSVVGGAGALVALNDPALSAKMPSDAELGGVSPDFLAEKMADVLEEAGEGWEAVAERIRFATQTYLTKVRAFQEAVTSQKGIRDASAEIAELRVLNLQAEVYIRRNAAPGSPAFQALTTRRKTSHKQSSEGASTKTAPKPSGETAPAKSAPKPSSEAPAPAPTAHPAPAAGGTAVAEPPAQNPNVAPALQNGVVHA